MRILILTLLLFSSTVYADQFEDIVDKLDSYTGTESDAMFQRYIRSFSKEYAENLYAMKKELPSEAVEVIQEEIISLLNEKALTKKYFKDYKYEFYKNNFTLEDMEYILEFYESDAGKKMISLMPKLVADTTKQAVDLHNHYNEVIAEYLQPRLNARMRQEGW